MSDIVLKIPAVAKDLTAMVKAVDCEKPTSEAVTALQRWLAEHPDYTDEVGNLVHMASDALLKQMGGAGSNVLYIAVSAQCTQLRDGLGWEGAPMIEKTLIEHIVMCWLRLYDIELSYHRIVSKEHTLTLGIFWEKRLSAAQRRYLRAIESLAKVRKLLRPDKSPIMAMLLNQQFHGR